MSRFLFRFGFQSSALLGSDLENSQCFWIVAPNEESALVWGQEVAEAFVRERWPSAPSWKESKFAFWIETKDRTTLDWAIRHAVPVCRLGEFPDWSKAD